MTEKDCKEMIIGSPANAVALKNVSLGKVRIFDTTLRDGIQAPGISLGEEDIFSLAKAIDQLKIRIQDVRKSIRSEEGTYLSTESL